jgi:hypothetical protein
MAIEHSPKSDCILRGISTQATSAASRNGIRSTFFTRFIVRAFSLAADNAQRILCRLQSRVLLQLVRVTAMAERGIEITGDGGSYRLGSWKLIDPRRSGADPSRRLTAPQGLQRGRH